VIARPNLRDGILEETAELDLDSLVLVATHTHSGPGGYLEGWIAERVTSGRFDPEAPERIARAAAEALARAAADLRPVRAGAGLGQVEIAANRREEGGPRETALPVLRLEGATEESRHALFAYGAHPVVLSPRSHVYSGDYPAAAHAWLAGRGWDGTFLPGPLGDQNPVSVLGDLWSGTQAEQEAQMREVGERLGQAVLTTLDGIHASDGAQLAAVERWVDLPETRLRRGCIVWWLSPFLKGSVRRFLSPRVPLHAVRVGDAVLVAVPAEPTARVGGMLRAAVPSGRVPFVIAHANDWIGYVVDAERYDRGGYEACAALHGPGLADWLAREAAETVRLLDAGAQP
jgi:hypothetical protein